VYAGAPAYTVSGTGTLTLNAGLINDATAAQTVSAPITFGQSNTIYNANSLTLGGAVNFTNFLYIQGGTTTITGSTGGSIGSLTSGNPVTPTVRVANGALVNNGAIGGAVDLWASTLTNTGSVGGRVDVRAGSTLQGTGSVGGVTAVAAGGTIRGDSGTGTGTLNHTSTVTLAGAAANGANLATRLAVSGGVITANSKLALSGSTSDLALAVAAGKVRFTLLGDEGLTAGNTYTITLATAAASTNFVRSTAGGNSGTDPFTTADFDLVSGSGAWSAFNSVSLVRNGVNLDLTFSPVPEPATVGLIAVGMLGVVGTVRRKRRPATELVA
jgi:hypothetical protein